MGFSIPFTSWVKGHISVDFLILKLPQTAKKIFNIVTRCVGIGLFLIIGSNLIVLGKDLRKAGEVSSTIFRCHFIRSSMDWGFAALLNPWCCFVIS